jgi:competence protein ComEA
MFLKRFLGVTFAVFMLVILAFGQFRTTPRTMPTPPTFPTSNDRNKADLVDINSASREQLAELGGIGDEYAEKVIASRPYKNKKELKTRKILPPANYKQVADKIIAKQPTK